MLSEVSRDGTAWTCLNAERVAGSAGPWRLLIGKVPYDGSRTEYTEAGGMGTVAIAEVKVYAPVGKP